MGRERLGDEMPTLRRALGSLVALAMLMTPSFGMAAGLAGLQSRDLGAGGAAVAPCDPNGVEVSVKTNGSGEVTAVTVSGLAYPACDGETLLVTLTGSSGAKVGDGSATVAVPGDGDETVPIDELPARQGVDGAQIAIFDP